MQTLATVILKSEPISLSSICPSFPLLWRHWISSTTSPVSRTYLQFTNIVFYLLKILVFYFQYYFTWEYLTVFFVDFSPAWVRHASAHADDADPDSSNTISQSVAMAIAGSPLPHAKANQFALPTVVSDSSRGQAVPLGPTSWQVTDQALCGRLLLQFDRRSLWLFCNTIQTLIQKASTSFPCSFALKYNCMS